jgi:hypothetical protein
MPSCEIKIDEKFNSSVSSWSGDSNVRVGEIKEEDDDAKD